MLSEQIKRQLEEFKLKFSNNAHNTSGALEVKIEIEAPEFPFLEPESSGYNRAMERLEEMLEQQITKLKEM